MSFRKLLVVLFLLIHCLGTPSVALDCRSLLHKKTCDECVKCGGIWCKNPQESLKCVSLAGKDDDWCPKLDDREIVVVDPNTRDGVVFRPYYEEMVAEINSGKIIQLFIDRTAKDIQSAHFNVSVSKSADKSKVDVELRKLKSKIEVTTQIRGGFCSATSQTIEHVFVEVGLSSVDEKAVLKYHVPCACACSAKAEARAQICSGFGDLICGSCRCDPDRRGELCECGKVSSSCVGSSTTKCSGNGHCDKCNTCQCNEVTTTPGSERFDPQDNCRDIITSTVDDFFSCLKKSEELTCGVCDHDIDFQKWNETLLEQRDGDRKLWVNLKTATGKPYWATRENGKIHVMRKPQRC